MAIPTFFFRFDFDVTDRLLQFDPRCLSIHFFFGAAPSSAQRFLWWENGTWASCMQYEACAQALCYLIFLTLQMYIFTKMKPTWLCPPVLIQHTRSLYKVPGFRWVKVYSVADPLYATSHWLAVKQGSVWVDAIRERKRVSIITDKKALSGFHENQHLSFPLPTTKAFLLQN